MHFAEKAIGELGERIIDTVYDYMQENNSEVVKLPVEQQVNLVSICLIGAKEAIEKTLTEKIKEHEND